MCIVDTWLLLRFFLYQLIIEDHNSSSKHEYTEVRVIFLMIGRDDRGMVLKEETSMTDKRSFTVSLGKQATAVS